MIAGSTNLCLDKEEIHICGSGATARPEASFDLAEVRAGCVRVELDAAMKTYVFSRTQPPGERDGMIFVNESPSKLLQKLRQAKGKNIWLMGGGELARDFLKEDLVDELYLGVVPVLLGEGIPLFPSCFSQLDFTLTENKTYSKGLISLKYERKRAKVRK